MRRTDHKSLIEKAAQRLPRGAPSGGKHSHSIESDTVEKRHEDRTNTSSVKNVSKIDHSILRANGIITPDNLKTRTMEELRLIKRGLLTRYTRNGADRQNLALITSAVSGEGKSFCALNLAMSIALEEDFHVLLVDCDVTRPTIMRTLGIEAKLGLIDVLRDPRLDLADVLMKTDIDKLTLLPPGTPDPRSAELLGSKSMLNLLDEIAHRYDDRFVIFDAPPVLMMAETTVLAANVGQIAFVIKSDSTTRDMVKEALDLIGDNPNIGLILNGTRNTLGGHKFGQYYDKYYGSKMGRR